MNPLVILGLTGLLFILIRARQNILNQLTVGLAGIVPDLLNLRLRLKIGINNPLPTEIPISTIIGSVSVNNTPVAEYANSSGFVLRPGPNIIEISAFPLLSNVVSSAKDILKGKINFNYTITSGPLSYTDTVFLIL